MVFAEIKPQIEQLTPEERLKALAFLKHLVRVNSPDYQAELARRNAEMDVGQKVRWTDLKSDLGLS
jgi:hypothetical protein